MTLNNSDDAQMSMKGLRLWAGIESKDLRPLPDSWSMSLLRQSGTRGKGTSEFSAKTSNFLSCHVCTSPALMCCYFAGSERISKLHFWL